MSNRRARGRAMTDFGQLWPFLMQKKGSSAVFGTRIYPECKYSIRGVKIFTLAAGWPRRFVGKTVCQSLNKCRKLDKLFAPSGLSSLNLCRLPRPEKCLQTNEKYFQICTAKCSQELYHGKYGHSKQNLKAQDWKQFTWK